MIMNGLFANKEVKAHQEISLPAAGASLESGRSHYMKRFSWLQAVTALGSIHLMRGGST
jgi:hypothetical protein